MAVHLQNLCFAIQCREEEMVFFMNSSKNQLTYKVIVVGDGSVGKTSLIKQYVAHTFLRQYIATVGIQVYRKVYDLGEQVITAVIWDLAGQIGYQKAQKIFFINANAIIYVYDITNRESFNNLNEWHKLVKKYAPNALSIMCGNKSDLRLERIITTEEGLKKARNFGCRFFLETSAKNGTGVDDLFDMLLELLLTFRNKERQKELVKS